ncbi:S-adenosyl-L-methionine-dependent methyltransferase [Cyathus striatus]|nr:S-adenosyl-L-methionine-dependent methyltransferase [Cyathus striatus]
MKSQIGQVEHRQDILVACGGIPDGSKVLELGCGQGDCTIVLADLVGEKGTVDAIDPAPAGYGSPYTVEQAQNHISTTTHGKRITWIRGEPLSLLPTSSQEPKYDIAVLAHCLWYFSSPSIITSILERLSTLSKTIYIAEWSLSTSLPEAQSHVFAALTQASLECRKSNSDSNVRTVVSPAGIKELAEKAGLKLVREGVITPNADVHDGKWEVGAVKSKSFLQEVEESVKDEREKAMVYALRDALLSSLEKVEGGTKGVRSMNVWCGAFEKA